MAAFYLVYLIRSFEVPRISVYSSKELLELPPVFKY